MADAQQLLADEAVRLAATRGYATGMVAGIRQASKMIDALLDRFLSVEMDVALSSDNYRATLTHALRSTQDGVVQLADRLEERFRDDGCI